MKHYDIGKKVLAWALCAAMTMGNVTTAFASQETAPQETFKQKDELTVSAAEVTDTVSAEEGKSSESTVLRQEFIDENGKVTAAVTAYIPEGAFQADVSSLSMEVSYVDSETNNYIAELMKVSLKENAYLDGYLLYDIQFKVDGVSTAPLKEIQLVLEGGGLDVQDIGNITTFYYEPANAEISGDMDKLVTPLNCGNITLNDDGSAKEIGIQGSTSGIYGCFVEKRSMETSWTQEIDGVTVVLTAPEGAFPMQTDGITMNVEPLSEEQENVIYGQLKAEADARGQYLEDYRAFDISLFVNGSLIQPQLPVTVVFEDSGLDAEMAMQTIGFQLDEASNTIQTMEGTLEADGTAQMEAAHFTPTGVGTFGAGSVQGSSQGRSVDWGWTPVFRSENLKDTAANDWQIVSEKYDTDLTMTEDKALRLQKNVVPADVENEFYVYMNIQTQMSFEKIVETTTGYVYNSYNELDVTEEMIQDNPGSLGSHWSKLLDEGIEFKEGIDCDMLKPLQPLLVTYKYRNSAGEIEERTVKQYFSLPAKNNWTYLYRLPFENKYRKQKIEIPQTGIPSITINLNEETGDSSIVFAKEKVTAQTVSETMGQYIEFQGVESYEFEEYENAYQEPAPGNNNTFTWNLKQDLPESTNPDEYVKVEVGEKDGNPLYSYYRRDVYRMLYKIRLKVEAEGFNSCGRSLNGEVTETPQDERYPTNENPVISYKVGERNSQAAFQIPEIRGLLYNIRFQKQDAVSGAALPHATFKLTQTDTSFREEKTTKEDGTLVFENLPWGTYKLEETSSPSGYEMSYPGEVIILSYTDAAARSRLEPDDKNLKYKAGTGGIITNTKKASEVLKDVPHSKYIDYLGDGAGNPDTQEAGDNSYRLYLDVTGIPDIEAEPADIILILDTTGSMDTSYGAGGTRLDALKSTTEAMINTLLPDGSVNRLSVITFAESAAVLNDGKFYESTDRENLLQGIKNIGVSGSTNANYQEAFAEAKAQLEKCGSTAKKFTIFVSDGEPNMPYPSAKEDGETAAAALKGLDGFYTVGIGDENGMAYLENRILNKPDANYRKAFPASKPDELAKAFAVLTGSVTKQISNATLTDTLSRYVQFIKNGNGTIDADSIQLKVTRRDKNQTDVSQSVVLDRDTYTSSLEDTDQDGRPDTIRVNFGENYFLGRDQVYTISFNVEATEAALQDPMNVVGDPGTDYPGNETSSGKQGHFSNEKATLSYERAKDNEYITETKEDFQKPVVQPHFSGRIRVQKIVSNSGEAGNADEFILHLSDGKSLEMGMVLKNNEISKTIVLKKETELQITETVPMEYSLEKMIRIDEKTGEKTAVQNGTVTVKPGDELLIQVYNRFAHTSYFHDKSSADNNFKTGERTVDGILLPSPDMLKPGKGGTSEDEEKNE